MSTLTRLERFRCFKAHPRYSKMISKMSEFDNAFCVEWIREHDDLTYDEFDTAVRRIVLTSEVTIMVDWPSVMTLLHAANKKPIFWEGKG